VPGPSTKNTTAVELVATSAGSLALRGVMVPHAPFPPGAERSSHPYLKVAPSGLVDTGYACMPDRGAMTVTASPPGIVCIGGSRFAVSELQDLAVHQGGTLTVEPDGLLGHRLAGHAADRTAVHAALEERGASPVLAEAFRDRPSLPSPSPASPSPSSPIASSPTA
jgi:hypothetical protein